MSNPYYDRQLKSVIAILESDYAGLALSDPPADFRYYIQAAGMAWKEGKLDQLLFLRYVSQMLATTMDRSLRLTVTSPEYTPWHAGFDVRRYEDALCVTAVWADDRLRPGDRITALNDRTPKEHLRRFQKNFLYSDVAEREMWGNVLKMADTMTVEHADARTEQLPILRVTGSRPQKRTDVCTSGDADHIIIDLRQAQGTDPEAFLPLIPYILSEEKTMNELDAAEPVRTLYTKRNCERRMEQLLPYKDDPEAAKIIAELKEHYGAGWVTEAHALWDDLPEPISPKGDRVTILTDTWTEGAPEWFVKLAKREGRAKVIGRATMGNLDFSTHIPVRVSETAVLTYATSVTEAAANGSGYKNKGIAPDVTIPFTPAECEEDLILKAAFQ